MAVARASAEAETTNVYVGVDLGTTYSCVSVFIPATKTYEYAVFGQDLKEIFPSTVYVSGMNEETKRPITHVGYEANALNEQSPKPDGYFYGFKRMMGISDMEANKDLASFPKNVTYKVNAKQTMTADGMKRSYTFPYIENGKSHYEYTPTDLSVLLLSHFKSNLDQKGYNIISTVVSTPAYFTTVQDEETALAAKIAGFSNVTITKEPIAACVYYAKQENLTLDVEEQVLVFDFGGGTLDISVVYVEKTLNDEADDPKEKSFINNISVNEYVGDNFLGGENINDELVAYFKSKMGASAQLSAVDALRLRIFAEEFKIKLCDMTRDKPSATYSKSFVLSNGKAFSFTLDMPTFNNICKPVFLRIMNLFSDPVVGLFRKKTGMGERTISPSDIHKVILVGGSTRVPEIKNIIKKLCPNAIPYFKLDADKSVARGACEICVNNDPSSGVSSVVVIGAVPLSVGIAVHDGTFVSIVKKSEPIPCVSTMDFTTVVDGQTSISVQVAIGERPKFVDNLLIGDLTLTLDKAMPRGVPQIAVEVAMDEQYAITVKATDKATGKSVNTVFDRSYTKPSQEKIDEMIRNAKENAAADAEIRAKSELYSSMSTAVDQLDKLLSFSTLQEDDKVHAQAILQGNKEWIEENRSNWALPTAVIESKLSSLKMEVETIMKKSAEAASAPKEDVKEEVVEPTKEDGREVF